MGSVFSSVGGIWGPNLTSPVYSIFKLRKPNVSVEERKCHNDVGSAEFLVAWETNLQTIHAVSAGLLPPW